MLILTHDCAVRWLLLVIPISCFPVGQILRGYGKLNSSSELLAMGACSLNEQV